MRIKTVFIFWAFFVGLAFLRPTAPAAEMDGSELWSMDFENVRISDALRQITQTTGLKIITQKRLGDQVITRSYKNQTIENILKDMFRDTSYALVWYYGEKGIDSVKILTLDKRVGAGAKYSPDAARSTIRGRPEGRYPTQRRVPPRSTTSVPRKSIGTNEPGEAEPDLSPEQQEKGEDQEEAESSEEEKESLGTTDESHEEATKPSGKLQEQSVEETEKGEKESITDVRQSEESGSSSPPEEEGRTEK